MNFNANEILNFCEVTCQNIKKKSQNKKCFIVGNSRLVL